MSEEKKESAEGSEDGVSSNIVITTTTTTIMGEYQLHTQITNENETGNKQQQQDTEEENHTLTDFTQSKKRASPYQLVFMEDLSSESSLAGSLSPQNLESSGSFIPIPTAETSGNIKLNSSSEDLRLLMEADENRSTVSSSTLIAESNISCETADTIRAESVPPRHNEAEEEGGGEGERGRKDEGVIVRHELDTGRTDDEGGRHGGISPSDIMIETRRSESVTPPPKSKEHVLSRLISDSGAVLSPPPFSPIEYHSGDEDVPGSRTPTFPIMTPSPLPSGTDSPDLGEQPAMSILFSGVFYLGSSTVDAPISETEANRKMNILHEQALTSNPMPIILSVPMTNDGSVLLKDPKTDQPLTTFAVKMILFCARGGDEALQDCFCLNVRHKRSGTYHCHVFRCEIMEATHKIFEAIGRAFKSMPGMVHSPTPDDLYFEVGIGVEILEDDGKGNFSHVTVDKDCFRLKQNTRKKVTMTIVPSPNNQSPLNIQRCFGMLLSPGKNLAHSQMNLLDNMNGKDIDNGSYVVSGYWDVGIPYLSQLNEETSKSTKQQYLTVAADLVMELVNEPVRFKREVKVRVSRGDMLSNLQLGLMTSLNKRKLSPEGFTLILAKVVNNTSEGTNSVGGGGKPHYSVVELREGGHRVIPSGISPSQSPDIQHKDLHDLHGKIYSPVEDHPHPLTSQQKKKLTTTTTASGSGSSGGGGAGGGKNQLTRLREEVDVDSDAGSQRELEDGEEDMMVSGWGEAEDMKEDLLKDWGEVLDKWDGKQREKTRPKQLSKLCRKGIPYHLRCQVWQMLSGAAYDPQLLESYRLLIPKESPAENIINMDMQRTYLGHDFFHEPVARDVLYKISKAYSIYDEEVGYCQGLSFIVAVLLLQKMPEEQAFAVLIKIMYQYHHRDVFKTNFYQLHLMFYQLDRLLKEYMEGLHGHFHEQKVETHMYSSQWFLTIFTAKFPISMVFRVMDVFLCEGPIIMFQIALAILKISKHDLKQLDFEGILNYFRESVPKRFQSEDALNELFRIASTFKVKERKLKELEKEYPTYLEQQAELEDPIRRLEGDNKHMQDTIRKLEQENEHLTRELVSSKASLREEMDKLEERIDTLSKEARAHKTATEAAQFQIGELREELQQAKEEYQKVMVQLMEERVQNEATVAEYKQLAQQMDESHQKQVGELNEELIEVKAQCSMQQGNSTAVKTASEFDHPLSEHQATLTSEERLRKLELELAQTKLALVESQCRNQELEKRIENSSSSGGRTKSSFLGRGKKKS